MFYKVKYTIPTLKIKTTDDYKERVDEILFWQIKDTIVLRLTMFAELFQSKSFDDFILLLFLTVWSVLTIPFAVIYIVLCLVELLLDTLFLPLFLIPIARILPISIIMVVWALSCSIGIFAGAALQRY